MSTYIELQADAFQSVLSDVTSHGFDFATVRRPFRGIEIKEDTYCVLKVIRSNGREIPLVDSGARVDNQKSYGIRPTFKDGDVDVYEAPAAARTFNYSNFIAQAIVEARSEKTQVVENFGEPYIFFFGEKPRVISVQGLLMNTLDFNWKNEFWLNYEASLRGTKLVEQDARIYLYYDNQIVEGYTLDAQASHDSTLPYHIPFSFTLFVTGHSYIGEIDQTGMYPIAPGVVDITSRDLTSMQNLERTLDKLRDRRDKLRPDKLISTLEDVRLASENAAHGIIGYQAIQAAIIQGLSDFEAKTKAFLDNVKTYFYGRRTVVPRGIAGAEVYAGEATYANEANFLGVPSARTLPLRSSISDNVDEYVGSGGFGATEDMAYVAETLQKEQNIDWTTYEALLYAQLADMGVDITDPTLGQTLRSRLTNAVIEMGGKVDFAAGIALHGIGSLMFKGEQIVSSIARSG